MKARGLDPGRATRPRLVQGDDEAKRDLHRRKFGRIMGEQMRKYAASLVY